MRLGQNWSYDGSTPETRDLFTAINPDSVIITSHAAAGDYIWLLREFPALEFTIRAKTGPTHLGTYPSDILEYREWDSERSLRDVLNLLETHGKTLRVQMGNEPDISMTVEPVDDPINMTNAILSYMDWWAAEAPKIRAAFPGVQLAPAPISQGNRDRFLSWAGALNNLYLDADFIVDHNYLPIGGEPADWAERYKWYRLAYADKPLIIGEFNDNGDHGGLSNVERAQRYAAYITQVANEGEVDEMDAFTLPGGAQDHNAPPWWFIDTEMAEIIAAADRLTGTEYVPVDPPEEVPVSMTEHEAEQRALVDVWNGETMKAPYNSESAVAQYWRAHIDDMGSALGPERVADTGVVFQAFARGVWKASPGDPWQVENAA